MEWSMMNVTIRAGFPDVETYLALKRAVGWPIPDPGVAAAALANTRWGFVVEKDGETIGTATVNGDGLLYFYIQDVMVHPDHQRRGLGTRLLDVVMEHIGRVAADKAYVALFAAKGLEPFYARYGFVARPNDDFGAGMFFIRGVVEGDRSREFQRG